MTIRRQWLMALVVISILAVIVNAFILSALTDRYFKDYMTASYQNHLDQIISYSETALKDTSLSTRQMSSELETHLDDPIKRIKLYNAKGNLLVDVSVSDENGNYSGRQYG